MDTRAPPIDHVQQVLAYLEQAEGLDRSVQMTVVDGSSGEDENFFIRGQKGSFDSVHHFAAAAVAAILREHRLTPEALAGLEVGSYDPEPWMVAYDRRLRPGKALVFPGEDVFGFKPPEVLHRLLWVEPKLSEVEECLVGESEDDFVLLYWHTSG